MDSPQCPLSKHISPLCERTNRHLIRSMRSDLETTVVKRRELAPRGLLNAAVLKSLKFFCQVLQHGSGGTTGEGRVRTHDVWSF